MRSRVTCVGTFALHRHARLLAIALVGREEQDAVLHDRSADRSAELVESDLGFLGRRRQERIARRRTRRLEVFQRSDPWNWLVPDRVIMLTWPPIEPPYSAVQHALDDLHLGDRLDAQDLDLVLAAVVAEAAVFRVGLGAAAVDRDGAAAVADAVHAEGPAATRAPSFETTPEPASRRSAGFAARPGFPSRRRHGLDLRGRARLHEGRGFGDRHRFREGANLERVRLANGLSGASVKSTAARRS